jgi:hypothetical protein
VTKECARVDQRSPEGATARGPRTCMVRSMEPRSLTVRIPGLCMCRSTRPRERHGVTQEFARVDQRSPEGAALNSPGWSAAEPRVVAGSRSQALKGRQNGFEPWLGLVLECQDTARACRERRFGEAQPGGIRGCQDVARCDGRASRDAEAPKPWDVVDEMSIVPPPSGAWRGMEVACPRGLRPSLSSAAASRLVLRSRLVLGSTGEIVNPNAAPEDGTV